MKENDTNVKILAMYLPQYHVIPENSRFWGEGFTDWVTVRQSKPLFEGHKQPKVPLNENYYDLSLKDSIKGQIDLAKGYGIYGFGIYHYWFSSKKQVLTKPAELILENKELDIPFFFAWDNISWKRTWSNVTGNDWSPLMDKDINKGPEILLEYVVGDEEEWEKHFRYLIPYFKDERYIKIDNKPVFVIFNHSKKMEEMIDYWNEIANKYDVEGVTVIYKHNPLHFISKNKYTFTYEPIFSGWGSFRKLLTSRILNKLGVKKKNKYLVKYDYDKIWNKVLKHAGRTSTSKRLFGAFVNYDDTPRRGNSGKVLVGGSSQKFNMYLRKLIQICMVQNKEYIFLTAWNEWGEGAYIEPDENSKYAYLEAVRNAIGKLN